MRNDISKSICDTIYQAVEKKNTTSNKDMTYICTVTEIYPHNPRTYRLTYEDTDYNVTLNNITLNEFDEVHLVIPQGDFSKKYVLEDVCYKYPADSGAACPPATHTTPGLMSAADKKKLDGIESNSQANIQADWNTSDSSNDSFIRNKPASLPASDVHEWAKAETKPAYTKLEIGLGNVPNVTTDNQTPSFTEASSRINITSGEKLSVIFGKIKKWFTDLKAVAFSGSYNDLSDKPAIPTVGNGTVTILQNGTRKGVFTMNQSENTQIELTDNNTTYSTATESLSGLLSSVDKKKLDGIASEANNYSLPAASSTVRGGVKVGYAANGKNYPVQLDNEQMFVNVPWTDTVTGVKGNEEKNYRTGNVNLTADNIGAVKKSGDTMSGTLTSSKTTFTHLDGNQGRAIINSTASAGSYTMLNKLNSTNGYFTDGVYYGNRTFYYTSKTLVDAKTNAVSKTLILLNESGNSSFPGTVSAPTFSGSLSGNATSASKLGSSTVGSASRPIYLSSGTPTACTGVAAYKELTQAQYNALSSTDKMNGTIYFIKD